MPISVFPVPSTTSNLAQSITAASANVLYSSTMNLNPGIYTITCTTTTIAHIDFFSDNTLIGTARTVSGSVSFNLSTAADNIRFYTNTGSSITINIAFTGIAAITSAPSGTLDTLNTTGTYNQTGKLYVVTVGGGGGGGGGVGTNNVGNSGGSGGAGGVANAAITANTAISYVIGAAGNGGNAGTGNLGNPGGTGGLSSFGNTLTANGGLGGNGASGISGSTGATGSFTTPNGASPSFPFVIANPYVTKGNGGGGGTGAGVGNAGQTGIIYVLRGV
jgi:hypothetical protein